MWRHALPAFFCILAALAEEPAVVRPKEIDDVTVNPGIGFMTFRRFNGDALNQGTKWIEGYGEHRYIQRTGHGTATGHGRELPAVGCQLLRRLRFRF